MDHYLVALASLLLVGVLSSLVSDRFGVPALLLFLIVGMAAGSEGPGGIYFDDASVAQLVGVLALAFILFSGGLDTDWEATRPVLRDGFVLATVGVSATALIVGTFARLLLGFPWVECLLLGAIVSSTDAAAVFSVLRAKSLHLKGNLKPLLEFESGSNDPMAVFLTVGFVGLLTQPQSSPLGLLASFALQMVIGCVGGYVMGAGTVFLINRLRLAYDGLYPVLTFSLVLLTYAVVNLLGGNGFLAVYLSGIVIGNRKFPRKRLLLSFHDGLAWMMQIAMFVTLGLLVFPSHLVPVVGTGLLIAGCLIFVARPVSVFLCLAMSRWSVRERAFISWVGLRGAVPVILATYPLLAGVERAEFIFNAVFFVVLTSSVLQGTTLPFVARRLGVEAAPPPA
jgi:cell volume regulation protein A